MPYIRFIFDAEKYGQYVLYDERICCVCANAGPHTRHKKVMINANGHLCSLLMSVLRLMNKREVRAGRKKNSKLR